MNRLPSFNSMREFTSRRSDMGFWWPYLRDILQRHGYDDGIEPVAGHNATYPSFICGDVVVKLFGYLPTTWASFEAERAALDTVNADPEIAAPRLLASGDRSTDQDNPWGYLIVSRVPGIESWRAGLSAGEWRSLAAELGRQVRRLHRLTATGVFTHEDWASVDPAIAAGGSSLPAHLVAQVDDYIGRLGPTERIFVNADIVANHVFVDGRQLSGIIDWGDALVTDRHVELIQIFRDTFACDRSLLRIFLDASDWPVDRDFPRRALGFALHRQALGMAQHPSIDVFEPIAARYPLQDIATLDELAEQLFGL